MDQNPLLQTKVYVPPVRPQLVSRPRLLERLNAGLSTGDAFTRALTLVSAPAGFGKTTLVGEWIHNVGAHGHAPSAAPLPDAPPDTPPHITWLSLDEGDNDPVRFLTST